MDTLKSKQEFDFVYKNGRKYYAKGFTIFYHKKIKGIALGLSVSKKVGNACKRNLIKRRFRALCALHLKNFDGLSLVFVPRMEVSNLSFFDLEKEFLRCLRFLGKEKKCSDL